MTGQNIEASASHIGELPLFYSALSPLSASMHVDFRLRRADTFPWVAYEHAVPLITAEFAMVQRHMPIVFTKSPKPVPIALMSIKPNTNVYVDADGALRDNSVYLPAYVRRYPFALARSSTDSDVMALGFDPSSGLVGQFDDGDPLFEDGEPTGVTNAVLEFASEFQKGADETESFIDVLMEHSLLREAELALEINGVEARIHGFMQVDQERLDQLPAATLRDLHNSGALMLIYLHVVSLLQAHELGRRHLELGDFNEDEA